MLLENQVFSSSSLPLLVLLGSGDEALFRKSKVKSTAFQASQILTLVIQWNCNFGTSVQCSTNLVMYSLWYRCSTVVPIITHDLNSSCHYCSTFSFLHPSLVPSLFFFSHAEHGNTWSIGEPKGRSMPIFISCPITGAELQPGECSDENKRPLTARHTATALEV